MNRIRPFTTGLAVLLLTGCAHQIVITPEIGAISREQTVAIDKKVGYYISPADREKQVTTPGGGGDKVSYYPYKELEPALQKVLYNVFRDVVRLDSMTDSNAIKSQGISLVFAPVIVTDSSSTGVMTWMPTNFSVSLTCQAFDDAGKKIWEKKIDEQSSLKFADVSKNFSAAPQTATLQAFLKLQREISQAAQLR